MQLTTLLSATAVAFAALSAAAPTVTTTPDLAFPVINGTTAGDDDVVEKRGVANTNARSIRMCLNAYNSGCSQQRIVSNGQCYGLSPAINDKMSSVYFMQANCNFYVDGRCTGRMVRISSPGSGNLKFNGISNQISSFQCYGF